MNAQKGRVFMNQGSTINPETLNPIPLNSSTLNPKYLIFSLLKGDYTPGALEMKKLSTWITAGSGGGS